MSSRPRAWSCSTSCSRSRGSTPAPARRSAGATTRRSCRSPSPSRGSGSSTNGGPGRRSTTSARPICWPGRWTSPSWRGASPRSSAATRCCAPRSAPAPTAGRSRPCTPPGASTCPWSIWTALRPRRARPRLHTGWRRRRAGRSTWPPGRCCGLRRSAWRRTSTPCSSRSTTSSPTAGPWGCWCARSRRSTPPSRRAGRLPCRSCPSSMPTSRPGSGATSRARSWSASSPGGGSTWPALLPCWSCRRTGRARPSRGPPAPRSPSRSPAGCVTLSTPWHSARGRPCSWSSSPPSRLCSTAGRGVTTSSWARPLRTGTATRPRA